MPDDKNTDIPNPRAKECDNTVLWNEVCETEQGTTKEVAFGRKFTAIDAASQIKRATELWGSFGNKWGLRNISFSLWEIDIPPRGKSSASRVVELAIEGEFFYPVDEKEVSFSIFSEMPYKEGNDTRKKLRTDIITKALSCLGFNADIFLGLFDDNKYMTSLREKWNKGKKNKGSGNPKPPSLTLEPQLTKDQNKMIHALGKEKNFSHDELHQLAVKTYQRGISELTKEEASLYIERLRQADAEKLKTYLQKERGNTTPPTLSEALVKAGYDQNDYNNLLEMKYKMGKDNLIVSEPEFKEKVVDFLVTATEKDLKKYKFPF